MIRLADSLKLAYTKIRTRKIRLFISVFTASLLFAGLTAGSLIFAGAMHSLESFSDEGFAKRYIIAGSFTDTSRLSKPLGSDPGVVSRAEALDKANQEKRKAAAKKLGIEYSPTDTDKAVTIAPDGNKYLNEMTLIGQQVLGEQAAQDKLIDEEALREQIGTQHVTRFYHAIRKAPTFTIFRAPYLSPLQDGEEKYIGSNQYGSPGTVEGVKGIVDGWTLMDDDLMKPFLLPGQDLKKGKDGSIPLIISYSAAQELLKLSKLDAKTTLQQKKQRLSDVRRNIAGKSFDVCYRNDASHVELETAISQQADIKQNANKKDYQKPDLLYGLPKKPCTSPVVQRDVRTASTKDYENKLIQLNRQFGAQEPQSELMHFRIVGVSPDRSFPMGTLSVEDLLSMVTSSTLGSSWVSPMSIRDSSTATQDIFRQPLTSFYEPTEFYLAEYTSTDVARDVLKNHNCVVQYPDMPLETDQVACSRDGRPFALHSFGSASLALDDIKASFRQFQLMAAVVIAVLASIILMGMIGRIIADARKETAVFRAVGASRLTVAQIYVTYTIYLVVLIVLVAFAIGLCVAMYIDARYGPSTSVTMALLFNVADLSKEFHYYSLDWYDAGLITAVVAFASLIGAAVPIAHNIQRNPIRDMRDE